MVEIPFAAAHFGHVVNGADHAHDPSRGFGDRLDLGADRAHLVVRANAPGFLVVFPLVESSLLYVD
ncbi:MAG: hypothetical protein VW547_04865 [Alphaproteobacteria bacterium]